AWGPAFGWLSSQILTRFWEFLFLTKFALYIRKAYRKLSLTLHPDKNKDENAETQFRQLVAIYEVLKDDERRQRYDDILINGLPDWRQPVFYYRRVRKMSNAELALLLFIILTVGHYAVVWSIYLEKQLDELLSRKKREKKKKAGGKTVDISKLGASEKNERLLVKPQWHDLLPCKLGIWFCLTLKALPHLIQDAGQFYAKYKETRLKEKEDELTRAELETLQKQKKVKIKKPKPEFPVYTPLESTYIQSYDHGTSIEEIEEQMDDWLENRNRTQKKQETLYCFPQWLDQYTFHQQCTSFPFSSHPCQHLLFLGRLACCSPWVFQPYLFKRLSFLNSVAMGPLNQLLVSLIFCY
ncbi:hypothetical protein FD754_017822, partial [Muntiacus muntjak]